MQKYINNCRVHYPLRQQTKEGYRIIYAKVIDSTPSNFDFEKQLKIFFCIANLWLREIGDTKGVIVILDALGMTWAHLPKFGINQARKLVAFVQVINLCSTFCKIYNISFAILKKHQVRIPPVTLLFFLS